MINKNNLKKQFKNTKGITLIALVVTIIVLLILAGVAIAMLTGDNSILKRAQSTQAYNIIGAAKDEVNLAYSEAYAEFLRLKYEPNSTIKTLDELFAQEITKVNTNMQARNTNTGTTTVTYDSTNKRVTIAYSDSQSLKTYTTFATLNDETASEMLSAWTPIREPSSQGETPNSGDLTGVDFGEKSVETVDTGDTITIGTEQFMILKRYTDKIMAMPYYNITLSTTNPVQDTTGDMYTNTRTFSKSNYWTGEEINIDMTDSENNIQQYIRAYSTKLSNATKNKVRAEIGRAYGDTSLSEFNDQWNNEGIPLLNPSETTRILGWFVRRVLFELCL